MQTQLCTLINNASPAVCLIHWIRQVIQQQLMRLELLTGCPCRPSTTSHTLQLALMTLQSRLILSEQPASCLQTPNWKEQPYSLQCPRLCLCLEAMPALFVSTPEGLDNSTIAPSLTRLACCLDCHLNALMLTRVQPKKTLWLCCRFAHKTTLQLHSMEASAEYISNACMLYHMRWV